MKRFHGFTLIEIPIVIFLIGLLIALFLPAISCSREAARIMQCCNNLKQQSIASLNYEATHLAYPSGGWDEHWYGDADVQPGPAQPGAWTYSLLPYLEQNALYMRPSDRDAEVISSSQKNGMCMVALKPLSVFCCPSRRAAVPRPLSAEALNCVPISKCAKGDYAANVGAFDSSCVSRQSNTNDWGEIRKQISEQTWVRSTHNGVIFDASAVTREEITDGTVNTYLIGEKYVRPDDYESWSIGDECGLYAGQCSDNSRSAGTFGTGTVISPKQDHENGSTAGFGSPHLNAFEMTMCDGSVQRISYTINGAVHLGLSVRNDGEDVILPEE